MELVSIFWISFEDELLAGQADGDDQDDGSGADDHAQRGEGKAHFAGAEAVEGQLENFAKHHGAAGAEQRLLEAVFGALVDRQVGFIGPYRRCAPGRWLPQSSDGARQLC